MIKRNEVRSIERNEERTRHCEHTVCEKLHLQIQQTHVRNKTLYTSEQLYTQVHSLMCDGRASHYRRERERERARARERESERARERESKRARERERERERDRETERQRDRERERERERERKSGGCSIIHTALRHGRSSFRWL